MVIRITNLNLLVGITDEDPFSVLEGEVCNEAELLLQAKLKNDVTLIDAIHLARFISAFWMGDSSKAMESSTKILSLSSSKMPRFQGIYHTCYRGIVAFRLFREGNGKDFMTEGNEVLQKVQSWRKTW